MTLVEIRKQNKITDEDSISVAQNFFTVLYHYSLKTIESIPDDSITSVFHKAALKSGKLTSITIEPSEFCTEVCFNLNFENEESNKVFPIHNCNFEFLGVKVETKMNEENIVHFYNSELTEERAKEIFGDCLIDYNSDLSDISVSTEFFD